MPVAEPHVNNCGYMSDAANRTASGGRVNVSWWKQAKRPERPSAHQNSNPNIKCYMKGTTGDVLGCKLILAATRTCTAARVPDGYNSHPQRNRPGELATCVPRLRQHQSFSRTLLPQKQQLVEQSHKHTRSWLKCASKS